MSSYIQKTLKSPIKLLIWVYLFLLIFEGALRKWILPGLSTPLLFARDPVALLIYIFAIQQSMKPFTQKYSISLIIIASICIPMSYFSGHGNLIVGAYGARCLAFHFPLIFVIGKFINREDVIQMGRFILLMCIPMTLLLVAQFNAPQNSFVNRLPGGDIGTGITGALGKFRPPGTFSFITGVVQFYSLAAAFIVSALVEKKYFPIFLTLGIAGAIVIAIPISISRTLFLNAIIIIIATVYGLMKMKVSAKGLPRMLILGAIGFAIAMQFNAFQEGMETFTARWELAASADGGAKQAVVGRFFGLLLDPLKNLAMAGLFGEGIGIGTIVGARLTTGANTFLVGEGEWGRLLMEMGIIFGLVTIIIRSLVTLDLARFAHRQLNKRLLLPWLLYASTFLLILNGQWGQSTTLGFTVFGAGLCISAAKVPQRKKKSIKKQVSQTKVQSTSPNDNRHPQVKPSNPPEIHQPTTPKPTPPSPPKPPKPGKQGTRKGLPPLKK